MPGKVTQSGTQSTSKPKEEEKEKKEVEEKKEEEKKEEASTSAQTPPANPPTPVAPTPAASGVSSITQALERLPAISLSDELISNVVAVTGMQPDRVKLALTVAQGNPDNAVELLFGNQLDQVVNQIINQSQQQTTPSTGNTTTTEETTPETNSSTASDAATATTSNNPLAYLRNDPQFSQVINAIRQNPALLPQVLQSISQSNPQLFQELQNNHEAFLSLLEGNSSGAAAAGTPAAAASSQGGQEQQPGQQRIELRISQEDRAAIDRLMALGFSEIEAVQAYMACDKNEQLAANFLFDS